MNKRKEEEWTSMPVTKETLERVKKIGRKGETYDKIMRRILKVVEK